MLPVSQSCLSRSASFNAAIPRQGGGKNVLAFLVMVGVPNPMSVVCERGALPHAAIVLRWAVIDHKRSIWSMVSRSN